MVFIVVLSKELGITTNKKTNLLENKNAMNELAKKLQMNILTT